MEVLAVLFFLALPIFIIIAIIRLLNRIFPDKEPRQGYDSRPSTHNYANTPTVEQDLNPEPRYRYRRKDAIMTQRETLFYHRLQQITKGKYVIFPQIHLSALAINQTTGYYRKLGFQRINRRSVDYIIAHPGTLRAVYAVELDDSTHNTPKGRANDALKNEILGQIGLPLVRLRNVEQMSDDDIIRSFQAALQ